MKEIKRFVTAVYAFTCSHVHKKNKAEALSPIFYLTFVHNKYK